MRLTTPRPALFLAGPALAILALIFLWRALEPAPIRDSSGAPENASRSAVGPLPRYDEYNFDNAGGTVLNFGAQPLWVPTSTITEAMARDRILARDLAAQGLALRFLPFLKGADLNPFLITGKLDAIVSGDLPTLAVAALGRMRIAALVNQGFISIVARRRMQLTELRGKTVGSAMGSSAHFGLLRALSDSGIPPDALRFAPTEGPNMPRELSAGRIDAFASWEPFTTVFLNENPGFTVLHRVQYSGFLSFTRALAETKPEAARLLLAAQLRAMSFMKYRRENLLTACAWAMAEALRFTGPDALGRAMTTDEYAGLVKSEFLDFVPVPIIPAAALEEGGSLRATFKAMRSQGLLPAEADWDKVRGSFDRSLIEETLAHPERYKLNSFEYAEP